MMMSGLPRETADLDVLVRYEDLEEASRRMQQAGGTLEPVGNEIMTGNLALMPAGPGEEPYEVDLLVDATNQPEYVDEALFSADQGRLSGPWLLATKVRGTREKDIQDAVQIWNSLSPQEIQQAKQLVARYMDSEAQENLETVELFAQYSQDSAQPADFSEQFASCRGKIQVRAWIRKNVQSLS